ncbi:hypothetical protein HOD20_10010 [archaeon]|nr:hypothetical protein [archaeon]
MARSDPSMELGFIFDMSLLDKFARILYSTFDSLIFFVFIFFVSKNSSTSLLFILREGVLGKSFCGQITKLWIC